MNCHYSAQGDYKCTKPIKEGFGQTYAQKMEAAKRAQIAKAIVEKAAQAAREKAARAAADAANKIKDAQRKAALKIVSDRRYR
jgi:hypothetical protein